MPKNKMTKPKVSVDLPDVDAIKKLFPKKVLQQVRAVVEKPEKKSIPRH